MEFEKVYVSLQQLFPQIDARALRAVSIEHSKDVDAAVVTVLEEIIPFFTEKSKTNCSPSQSVSVSESSDGSVSRNASEPFYVKYDGHGGEENTDGVNLEDRMKAKANVHSQGESLVVMNENSVETHQMELSAGTQTEGTVSADKYPESSINVSCDSIPQPRVQMLQDLDMYVSQKIDCIQETEDIAHGSGHDICYISGRSVQLVEEPVMHGCNLDESKLSLSNDTATSGKSISNIVSSEDKSILNATISRQMRMIDAIEEVIADAKNYKKALFLEMESVLNLVKQVEAKEEAAKKTKTEATGGMDLLNEVEELKRMLKQLKKANDMHTGEVYGEKAILATELRELQTRMRSLSEERDASHAILDEMRQSLEARLSAAVDKIKSADLRKLEKEEVAQKFLAEHELIMEKVVQEAKILRQQAEDNAKLEEFLLDRGRVVDTLQGEIAVICQDVKLLKERFDQHVPLGKSLFSGPTSFMLASLSSSLKNMVVDQVQTVAVGDGDQLETENNREHEKIPEDEAVREHCKSLIEDDDWMLCDSSQVEA